MSIIKVFANSRVSVVAADIVGIIRDRQQAELLAVEEEAVNLAFKAVDLVIVYFRQADIDIHCVMDTAAETADENAPRATKLIVQPQNSAARSLERTQQFPILN